MKHYIIMADIVNSSDYAQKDLMASFKHVVDTTNRISKNKLSSPLTITLGDEFQGVCNTLRDVIDVIFTLKNGALQSELPFLLRFSCVYGKIDTDINRKTAYGMLGDGLTKARKLLNDKGRDQPNLQIDIQNFLIENILQNSFEIMSLTEKHSWVNKDAKIISDFIYSHDSSGKYLTDTKIGRRHKKNQSQISKYKKNWDIESYRSALNLIYTVVNNVIDIGDGSTSPSLISPSQRKLMSLAN